MVETVREKGTVVYEVVRCAATVVFHTIWQVRYHHTERIPKETPFVIISNHVHALDPGVIGFAIKNKQPVYLGKKELAKNKLFARFLAAMHCILVDRHHADMEAMRACMKAVKMNKILVIFPEGTRHHEGQMEQIESGASLIILRSRVPVCPMYIDRPLTFFRKTNVYVGNPISYDDLLTQGVNAETCEKLNQRFRETYRNIIAESENEKIKKSFKKRRNLTGRCLK